MSYDEKGLGVAEMTFLSVNYPDIFDQISEAMDEDEALALNIARKAIACINGGLI